MEDYIKVISCSNKISGLPEYITILPRGYVSSVKGDFIVDMESFQMINDRMKQRSIDIVIDYEHQSLGNVQAPASGWIKEIVLKEDGISARVEWTDKAKAYLLNNEYRYVSPVVIVRKQDKKVVQLHSVALTNCPAINGMMPIANSTGSVFHQDANSFHNDRHEKILDLLNLSQDDFYKYGY